MPLRNQNRLPRSPNAVRLSFAFFVHKSLFLFEIFVDENTQNVFVYVFYLGLDVFSWWINYNMFCFFFLFQRKEPLSSIPTDKRRKVETQGAVRRQVLSTVNRQDVTTNSDVGSTDECGKVYFTKDEVLALLNERAKAGKFDTKVCLINVHHCCRDVLPLPVSLK